MRVKVCTEWWRYVNSTAKEKIGIVMALSVTEVWTNTFSHLMHLVSISLDYWVQWRIAEPVLANMTYLEYRHTKFHTYITVSCHNAVCIGVPVTVAHYKAQEKGMWQFDRQKQTYSLRLWSLAACKRGVLAL